MSYLHFSFFLLLNRCEEVFRVPTSVGSIVKCTESPTEVGTLSTCIQSFLDRPSCCLLWFSFQRPPPIHTVASPVIDRSVSPFMPNPFDVCVKGPPIANNTPHPH